MLEQSYYDKADEVIASHGLDQASLIPIIQDIQSEYRYLPPELLGYVAKTWHHGSKSVQCGYIFMKTSRLSPREICDQGV